ncbi:efflux transporter outer membrane subunit [Rubritalea spongiae]|uniref:Efflux transporter outer membrane subunit n=1 Tax=Rubritalea spongiae TaxID=430797 RepID=A0ABW5E378_9BACT
MTQRAVKFLLPIAACISLAACSQLVKTHSQSSVTVQTPSSWKEASKGQNKKISSGWLNDFNSPAMNKLVNEALNNNPNINAAAARLRAAKEGTISAQAAMLPTVGANTGTSHSRFENGDSASTSAENYNLRLNASWEPDLWGRLRDLRDSSLSAYQADVQQYRGARLSLAANTAKAWCNLVTAQNQVDLAKNILESFNKNNAIVERNYKAGVPGTRAIDVQFSRNNVASAQRTLKSRTQDRDEASRQLEQLLGRYPSASIIAAAELPDFNENPPASIPSELLIRRPDLAAAQLRIYQSAKQADAAQKNLLPSINLSGSLSTNNAQVGNIFDPNFLASNVAASLTQSIYRGGELQANVRAALDRNKAAIYDFSDQALTAFREVENALAADKSLAEQEKFLLVEVRQAQLAVKSSELDYSEGLDSSGILEILEAQRRANNSRAQLISLKNRRLQNRIDLHLALGGDFYTPEPKS